VIADVVVVGAGPAGATVATRLAQLGHHVVMLDRGRRRSHNVETLSPVTLDLLQLTGADCAVRHARFPGVESMSVEWGAPRRIRPMAAGSLLVDRDRFDALLVDQAADHGVTLRTNARATWRRRVTGGWEVATGGAAVVARFLVDASGRPATLRRSRPDALLGVTGCWDGAGRDRPGLVALDNGWVWAAAGPRCDVTVFVDPPAWRALDGEPVARYTRLVEAADVVSGGARLVGGVSAADASGALARVSGPDWLAVGDAALALDPLSSSGVQHAIQGALTATAVVHTGLTSPHSAALALNHYGETLVRAAAHHVEWTRESYAAVAAVRPTPFWTARAGGVERPVARMPRPGPPPAAGARVRRSPSIRFVEVTQVVGDTVQLAPAVEHPGFDGAVAYVGGTPVVPLLAPLDGTASIGELIEAWARTMPATAAAELAGWFLRTGALEEVR
jgi:flavin-dependent dehydrogenase